MKAFVSLAILLTVSAHSAATPAANGVAMSPTQDYLKVIVALVFIVGLIFACAWLIRRMSGGVGMNHKHLKILSVLPLGTREKLMIIQAADEYLLLGVPPQGISTLHRFDEPIDLQSDSAASPFADRLKGLLKGLDSDPLAKHRSNTTSSGDSQRGKP